MIVSRPSTPASYFHLLRRQAYARPRKPLIVFTPKAMLRLRGATSPVEAFTQGRFEPVIDDDRGLDRTAVKRVLVHSGKVHWDLRAELEKNPNPEVALVRLEQLYPTPIDELKAITDSYPNAELVWVQEEPENQGAWPFLALAFADVPGDRSFRPVSRTASASPATGSSKVTRRAGSADPRGRHPRLIVRRERALRLRSQRPLSSVRCGSVPDVERRSGERDERPVERLDSRKAGRDASGTVQCRGADSTA